MDLYGGTMQPMDRRADLEPGRTSIRTVPVPARAARLDPVIWADEYAAAFTEHHLVLVRLAYLLCGEKEWAEDAVADAFAATYPRWKRGAVSDVGAYLRWAVVNQVRGGIRRRIVERRHAARRPPACPVPSVEQRAVNGQALRWALDQLPTRQRAAVVLRYYADLSVADAARALDCSRPTLKTLSSRGVARLRELLADDGGSAR